MTKWCALFFLILSLPAWADEGLQPRIHFASNSDLIQGAEENFIAQNISWMKNNPRTVIILEGHCDEWGDRWYNLELGDRRARAVKAYLIEQGVSPDRVVMVVSYGSDRPLNTEHTNDAWRENRRVEFVLR